MTIIKTVCSADEKFDGTYPTNVVVTNEGADGYVILDAVRFTPIR